MMLSQTYTAKAIDAYFAGGRGQWQINGDIVERRSHVWV